MTRRGERRVLRAGLCRGFAGPPLLAEPLRVAQFPDAAQRQLAAARRTGERRAARRRGAHRALQHRLGHQAGDGGRHRAGATAWRASRASAALASYEAERKPEVDRFQRAAFESLLWFEGVERYIGFDAGPVRIQPADPLAPHHRTRT